MNRVKLKKLKQDLEFLLAAHIKQRREEGFEEVTRFNITTDHLLPILDALLDDDSSQNQEAV